MLRDGPPLSHIPELARRAALEQSNTSDIQTIFSTQTLIRGIRASVIDLTTHQDQVIERGKWFPMFWTGARTRKAEFSVPQGNSSETKVEAHFTRIKSYVFNWPIENADTIRIGFRDGSEHLEILEGTDEDYARINAIDDKGKTFEKRKANKRDAILYGQLLRGLTP